MFYIFPSLHCTTESCLFSQVGNQDADIYFTGGSHTNDQTITEVENFSRMPNHSVCQLSLHYEKPSVEKKKEKKIVYGQITAAIFPHCLVSRPIRANTDVLTVCRWVLPNRCLSLRYKLAGKQRRETFEAHNCV